MTESTGAGSSNCPSCGARMGTADRFCSVCGTSLPPPLPDQTVDDPARPTDPKLEAELRDALAPNYLLIRQLGVGGMGTVYLAREPALKRLVAVKVLARELAVDASARARFEREAEAVAGVSHPNVVAIYGVGELADGTPYFIMQHVGGDSMATRLLADGPLPVDDVKQILGGVASALATAHKRGIIHRDIKPSNILHDEETGRALVSDFGIAAVRASGEQPQSTKLTQTGMALGTPMYMSPEQLLAEEVTDRTDVYALGLTGYELLTNRGPFDVTSPQEMMAAHLRDTPAKLSKLRADVDPEFESLLEACLAKDAAARPSAEEIARRLVRGAPALLEWPPPGLEPLHGRAVTVARHWGAGSVLSAAAFLLMIGFAGTLSSAFTSFATLMLWLAMVFGLVVLVRATHLTLRMARDAIVAFRIGYRVLTLLEVAADRRGDTGALIAGLREYATLPANERSALRRGRLLREGVTVLASLSPIPGFIVLQWLAAAGIASPGIAPFVVFGAMIIMAPVALSLARRERRRLRTVRRRLATRHHAPDRAARLVAPWYVSFEGARGAQSLGAGPRGRPGLSWGALAAVTIGVLGGTIVALPVGAVGTFGPLLWQLRVDARSANDRLRIAEVARPYSLPPDSSITARQAGHALYTLSGIGRDAHGDYPQHQPPRELDFTLLDGPTPFGTDLAGATDSLWDRVRIGFTPAQRRYLEQLSAFPGFDEFAIVARAPAIDQISARFVLPFPDSVAIWGMPLLTGARAKDLAYASVARAAYLTTMGRLGAAETALRETISFGFVTSDGPTLIETLMGTVVVGIGRWHLEQFYRATGRVERADRIRTVRDSAVNAYEERSVARAQTGSAPQADIGTIRRLLIREAMDTTVVRAVRWERVLNLSLAPCTNARDLLFGPHDDIPVAIEQARATLVRTPGEAELFELITRGPEESIKAYARAVRAFPRAPPSRVLYPAARVAAALLRNDRLAGCAGLLLNGQYF